MPCMSFMLPSATCDIEMPSFALRCACARLRMFALRFSEMPRPAASSDALLMRIPEDNRPTEAASADCVEVRLRCALREATLVRTEIMGLSCVAGYLRWRL